MSPTDFFNQEEYQPWTLAQIYADLAASGEVARALNVPPGRVQAWIRDRATNGCPMPIRMLGPTNVFSLQEWQDWYMRYLENHKWLVGHTAEHPDLLAEARRFFGE